MNEKPLFSDKQETSNFPGPDACMVPDHPWKILVIDDESAIHDITEKVLASFTFQGRGLSFLHAYSGSQALDLIRKNPDTAIVLLDMILDKNSTGFDIIHHIRKKINNHITQIIIRTGQPGYAPEHRIIEEYDINDYRLKTELTAQKLFTVITASLRAFDIKSNLQKELENKRRIEKILIESEQRFKDIANSIGDLIWEMDPTGVYTYATDNPGGSLGYSSRELIGKPFTSLVLEVEGNSALKTIQKKMSKGEPFFNLEIWKLTKNGSRSCLLTSGKPLVDDQNRLTGYRGVDRDITDLKLAEREKEALVSQLRQAQRLESIGTLAGGIAHDFNNILGAILGYTQILQLDVQDNEKGTHYTRQIINSCNRAKNLILQILDFSRHSSKNVIKTAISPSTVIKEALKLLRASIPSSIKIQTRISNDAGFIMADPTQIHHIIMNLCTNSFQAMAEGQGTILISITRNTIGPDNFLLPPELTPGDYVVISVKDDGKGIEPDTMEKIFEPYFSTRKGGDGTGLGLSIVHGIVRQHGGSITVKSKPGQGTEFTIYFPRYEKRDQETASQSSAMIKGQGKILFIDDDQMLVDLGKSMLERLGYNAVAMNSATRALELVRANPLEFDLVITDMTMPDMQGTQLADKVKAVRPNLPVILVTGLSSIATADKASASGIDTLLSKPLSMNALAEAVHAILINTSSKPS
ncbi:MAG: response regulator [Pseudomonadota bacterium]